MSNIRLEQYENDACRLAMQAHAKAMRLGAKYNHLAFYRALLSPTQGLWIRVTRSHDSTTLKPIAAGSALWHLSASVGIGSHGTGSTRPPTDSECQAVINQLGSPAGSPLKWEEYHHNTQDPNVRHFWEVPK